MTTDELNRALDAEGAAAVRLRRVLVELAEAEEQAEDRPDDAALLAEADRLTAVCNAAEAEVTAARGRREGSRARCTGTTCWRCTGSAAGWQRKGRRRERQPRAPASPVRAHLGQGQRVPELLTRHVRLGEAALVE